MNIIHTSDGQPLVGSPKMIVLPIITKISKNEIIQNKIPINEARISGVVENAVIASKAYFVNYQKDHFVSPATL